MNRGLRLVCLSLLAVGLVAPAAIAGGSRPSIGILGLEVNDPNGAPTPTDAQVAKELSDALRSRSKVATGPYTLQSGSDKELIDEKVLKNCDSEAIGCMAQIGTDLGADFLIYGSIAKKGGAYEVKLTLFDVANKAHKNKLVLQIPVGQLTGAQIQVWAKTIYNRLTGQGDTGQVLVKISNSGDLRGSIKIDGEDKGTINSSTGTASGIGPGKHTVTVVVGGYKPKDVPVTVTEGQTANVPVELDKDKGDEGGGGEVLPPGPGPGPGPGHEAHRGDSKWKAVAVAGFLVGAGGGALWIYGYSQISDADDHECKLGLRGATNAACPVLSPKPADIDQQKQKWDDQGDAGKLKTIIGATATVAGGALMIYSIYKGFFAKNPSNEEHAANGHRVHRDRFVVTPIITSTGGGAGVQFDW